MDISTSDLLLLLQDETTVLLLLPVPRNVLMGYENCAGKEGVRKQLLS